LKQTIILRYKGSIIFWLAVVLLSIVITSLSSCSSRKVVIDEVKKDSLSQISTKIVTEEVIKIENNIITDEFTIEPLDTCKDIVVNGIKYRNAILKYKTTKDNTIQNIKVSKVEDIKQTTKVEVKQKKKNIEKTSYSYLLWLLIPIAIYIIYKIYG
jgi:hypothetical protein